MLIVATVEEIQGSKNGLLNSADSLEILIAAEKCGEIKTVQTTKSQFKYPFNGVGVRASASIVTADETIADIRTAANTTTYQKNIEIIPTLDEAGGTVTNLDLQWDKFLYGIASSTTGESFVWFHDPAKFLPVKYRVNATLAELVTLADTGVQPT
jgi:hypothetical protein